MDIDSERAYPTPLANATLLPMLLLSLTRQKHSPNTARYINTEYDYIIVGAGSAGSVVAGRLSEKPCVSVLLLEAGRPPPLLTEVPALARSFWYTDIDWQYKTAPQKYSGDNLINRQIVWPSGKALGGSSVLHGMQYVRGNRKNYDDWAADGAKGWSYHDVLPYFKKMEDNRDLEYVANGFHGVGGPQTVHRPRYNPEIRDPIFEAAKELGYEIVDPNGARQTGYYDLQATMRAGQRCSSAKAYLVPAENRTNLDILPNAMVRKVLIKNSRAVGVQFNFQGTTYEVTARKEVIMSAGTVNTAQLLMLSGIGPRKELERFKIPVIADLPVGQNFQDHCGTSLNFLINPNIQPLVAKVTNPANIVQYIQNRTGPLGSAEFAVASAFLNRKIRPKKDFPNFEFAVGEGANEIYLQLGVTPQTFAQTYAPYQGRPYYICIVNLLQPRSRGTVTLQSTDPYDLPVIDPNYYEDPKDIQDVVDGLKACNRLGNSAAMRRVGSTPFQTLVPGCEKFADDEDAYFWCLTKSVVFTLSHPVGTVKMGDPKDSRTVVDPKLRVKTIKGLRVVDASVMPIIPSGNTNIPTMMIAEKASDIIKRSIKCHKESEEEEWTENEGTEENKFPLLEPLHPEDIHGNKDWNSNYPESQWSDAVENADFLPGNNRLRNKNVPKVIPWNKEIPNVVPWNLELLQPFNPEGMNAFNESTSGGIESDQNITSQQGDETEGGNSTTNFRPQQSQRPNNCPPQLTGGSQSSPKLARPSSQEQSTIQSQNNYGPVQISKTIPIRFKNLELKITKTINIPQSSNAQVNSAPLNQPQQSTSANNAWPPLYPMQGPKKQLSASCDREFCNALIRFMQCQESISCTKRKEFATYVYGIMCYS